MSIQKRGVLLGMLLGDGCLKVKPGPNGIKYFEYVLCHSKKQEDYLEFKRDLFHSIIGGKSPKIHYDPKTNSVRFSRCHKKFRIYHKTLYSKDSKKYFSNKVFRYLTPQAIALWYMDDGCLSKNKVNGKITSLEMRLYTYFSEEEADTAINYFLKTYGIIVKKRHYMKKGQWNLIFNTKESLKFEKLIEPYIIPSMQYKLPSYFTRVLDTTNSSDDIV